MNNALFQFAKPANEPVKEYRPGSPERIALEKELEKQSNEIIDIPIIIGGKEIRTGDMGEVVMPHNHKHVVARYHKVGEKEVNMAIEAALALCLSLTASSYNRFCGAPTSGGKY